VTKSAADRAEVRFKQLCCLGLGAEEIVPALLRELQMIVPSLGSTFFFLDAKSELSNVYDENPAAPSVALLYLEQFYKRPDREMGAGFPDAFKEQSGVQGIDEILNVDRETFYRSDLYNLVYRALGYDGMIRVAFWDHNRPVGGLMLSRSPGDRPFGADERRRLGALQAFFAHALSDCGQSGGRMVESGRSGLIVADASGGVVYASAEGRSLLFLATHANLAVGRPELALPARVVLMCENLARIFQGAPSAAAPPTYRCQNVWGGFNFRAQWLDGADCGSGLIGIAVSHQEPLPIKLLRRAGELPLSPRQAEISALMAQGHSLDEIAGRLGLSKHTAVAHGRTIYEKLGVHNRSELLGALLADQVPPQSMH
jgi:DNA-binding CsgD family transcriptional regulator